MNDKFEEEVTYEDYSEDDLNTNPSILHERIEAFKKTINKKDRQIRELTLIFSLTIFTYFAAMLFNNYFNESATSMLLKLIAQQ